MNPGEIQLALSGAPVAWRLLRDDGSAARFIHRFLASQVWSEKDFRGRLGLVLGFLALPLVTPFLMLVCTGSLGPAVKKAHGRGFARQLLDQAGLFVTTCIPPHYYYVFELYERSKRRRALDYLYRFETKRGVYRFLKAYLTPKDTLKALSNKMLFADRCRDNGVPAIPVLALVEKGRYRSLDETDPGLPEQGLFVKPVSGRGGSGAERWTYSGGRYSGPDGRLLTPAQLIEHLERASRDGSRVVRPWLEGHPELADLSCGVLCTARVLTCRDEAGGFEVTHALFKMARKPDDLVDNVSSGGIASKVDLATGELGRATDQGLARDSGWWDRHPSTGATITGRKLPDWDRVLGLALEAHRVFPDQVMVGWDIALLESGPVLVEGNKGPGIDVMQRAQQEPLGASRYGELLAFHLRRAQEERQRRREIRGQRKSPSAT